MLVVDDNPHVLSALVDLIDEEPTVDLAAAALRVEDSIALAMVQCPDAVLVDARMPDGGGERVVSEIRAFLPSARIVVLSVYVDTAQTDRLLAAGADLCVRKDTDVCLLMRRLSSYLLRRP